MHNVPHPEKLRTGRQIIMATGLTHFVEKGTLTELADFIRSAVPQLNDISSLRKSVEDADIRVRDHRKRIKKAKRGLAQVHAWSDETVEKKAAKEFRKAVKEHAERLVAMNLSWYRYNNMLLKVEAWQPPSEKLGERLKKSLIQELSLSIEYDCGGMPITPPVLSSVDDYRQQWIQYHKRIIEIHEGYLAGEVQKAQNDLEEALALIENLKELEAQS